MDLVISGLQWVKYFGHIISEHGVATDPSQIDKVLHWPSPKSKLEVQQFLGLTSYYRRFILDFATIAKPLHRLTEQNRDFSKPFLLDIDASDGGIGGVLSQLQADGSEQVVGYGSCTLSKSERNYCVTRRELLAMVYFVDHFRRYLLGRKFTLRTDHAALKWLQSFKSPEGKMVRWLEKLQDFDFVVVHRKGKKHLNADALSQLPCVQCGQTDDDNRLESVYTIDDCYLFGKMVEELHDLQSGDPSIGPILQAKRLGAKSTLKENKQSSLEGRRLLQLWDQLHVQNEMLYRVFESTDGRSRHLQWVVPAAVGDNIIRDLHEWQKVVT
ncbi:hypothetical protein EMCRGX_G029195 [Ephydatia muelleri]